MKIGRSRTLQSAKYLEKKRKRLLVTYSLISFVVVVVIALMILILRIPFFQISNVVVRGNTAVNTVELQNIALNQLKGNYALVIPKSNFIFYPKSSIEDAIYSSFPKIDRQNIELDGINSIHIDVTERAPSILVCDGYSDDGSDESCYFADSLGFVYEKSPIFSENVYFKYFMNTSSSSVAIGSVFLNKDRFAKLQQFISELNSTIIDATGLLIGDDGSYELYIKNPDGSSGVVYFDDRTPLENTKSNLLVFWQNALDKKIGLTHMPSFEYVNLRFGKNIFYLIKTDNAKQE